MSSSQEEGQRPTPPYLRITEHYRDRIRRGELRHGDRLPSTRQLAAQWGIAHATAAKVLQILRGEGLATAQQGGGGGTTVNVHDLGHSPRDRLLAVRHWGKIYPPGEYARIVAADLIAAPDHVAAALGVDPAAPVIRRRRVTYRDDTPVSMSISWFDGALAAAAPDLLRQERIQLGTPGYIERVTGRRIRYGHDEVSAALADATHAAELAVPAGSPVLIGRNWIRDGDGDVIEFGESVSLPTRWQTYEYELA